MKFLTPFLSLLLTPLMVVSPLSAQLPVAAPGVAANNASVQDMQLRLVDSEDFEVQVNSRSSKGFTVAVMNSDGTPVKDAAVAFRLPDSGPTGTFPDGTHAAVAYTDGSGRAHFQSIQWGPNPGMVAVRITANKGIAHAGMLIEQAVSQSLASNQQQHLTPFIKPPQVDLPAPSSVATIKVPSQSLPEAMPMPQPRSAMPSAQPAAPSPEPAVSVTNSSPDYKPHSGKKKWFIIAAVAVGAGVGVALAGKSKSSSNNTSSGISIGTPSVSIGHP